MMDGPDPRITPETPGRPAILNPFESPNDYHHLHESLVPSPSIFKTRKPSGATPAKFCWSIDDMASMHPVHIDPEDIHRQSLYFSQRRTDVEIEEKRQNAIEQFFTKEAIVPSPWAGPANKQSSQLHAGKSPLPKLILEEPLITKKNNVSCQTTLSLPAGLDVEEILAAYYISEELCDQVQESLSTSSLRRKLFLDGQGSGSDSSNPSSPEREATVTSPPGGGQEGGEILSSPFSCGMTTNTPSTGQFSSSPIQVRGRAYSLGNGASPLFPDKSSPATFKSPKLSPIGPEAKTTPQGAGERKKLSFVTPEATPLDMEVNTHTESPYVEGCSPIRSCSPLRPQGRSQANPRSRARCWASPPCASPILNPKLLESQNVLWLPPSPLPVMEVEPYSPSSGLSTARQGEAPGDLEPIQIVEAREEQDERIAAEEEEEGGGVASACLTSSRMGSVLAVDTSNMFVSLLAEGSCIPTDSSMQVDSGYNTYSVSAASLIDGTSDGQSKESFSIHPTEDAYSRHTRNRVVYPNH